MANHIGAEIGQIAKNVIMPGDPLRAKKIAEDFLQNVKLVNEVRAEYGYTGTYKGKEVSVMASGMGCPSMGIYSYELYKIFGVDNIIRIGTAGSYREDIKVLDVVLAENSYSKSTFAQIQNSYEGELIPASETLNKRIIETAKEKNMVLHTGNVHCSDVIFYGDNPGLEEPQKYNCIAAEMESFALFANANMLKKEAACLLTISNMLVGNMENELTAKEREEKLGKMIELALDTYVE